MAAELWHQMSIEILLPLLVFWYLLFSQEDMITLRINSDLVLLGRKRKEPK